MRHLVLLLALTSIACSERAPESPAELRPDPAVATTEDEPATQRDDPAEPAPAPVRPRSGTVEVVDLPDVVPPLPTIRTRVARVGVADDSWGEEGTYHMVRIPEDPATEQRINDYLAHRAGAQAEYPSTCRLLFAHPKLLSLSCEDIEVYERGGSESYTTVSTVEVKADAVETFDLRDVMSPTLNFDALMRTACAGAVRRGGATASEAEETCRGAIGAWEPGFRLNPRGVEAAVHVDGDDVPFTVPFSQLDRGVYADTTLGQVLAALPGASIVEIELPPGTVRQGATASGLAFGEADRVAVSLGRWMQLPSEVRSSVVIAGGSFHYRLARPADAVAEIEAVRAAIGEPGEVADWPSALVPRVVRTRTEASFRSDPSSDRILILPEGTILAAAIGRVDRRDSAMGRPGTWALTAAAPGVSGFTAGNLLVPHDGCEPPAAPFIDAMQEGFRETAAASVVRALVTLRRGGREQEVIAYGAAGRRNNPRRLGASRIDIYERGDECAPGRRIARHDLEGNLFAMRFTSTHAHGGATLLLAGTYLNPSRLRWQLFRIGDDEPLWTTEVSRSVDVLTEETVDGEYFPLVVDTPTPVRVAWTGDGVEVRE